MTLNKSLMIPLVVFALLVLLLALGFTLKDPHFLPSELIDRPFPEFSLEDLHREQTRTREDVIGDVVLVNVWATWCSSCYVEHPVLMDIARSRQVALYGVNYKDRRARALQWLQRYANPYRQNIYDPQGQLAINLGVYGTPETFIIDAHGIIRYRYTGPISPAVWQQQLLPIISRLRRTG